MDTCMQYGLELTPIAKCLYRQYLHHISHCNNLRNYRRQRIPCNVPCMPTLNIVIQRSLNDRRRRRRRRGGGLARPMSATGDRRSH